jgi:MFS family permease
MLSGNMLIDALEVSTVVVAMPSIGRSLHLAPSSASWFMTCFALGFGGFILPGARLTARLGRRRMYLAALLVFAVASLAAGLAADPFTLAATRVVKGLSVAVMAPTGLAIIANTFADGPARRRALAVYSLFGASGFSAGLVLTGALTLTSWRWALVLGAPVGLLLFLFGLRLIPGDATKKPPAPPASSGPPAASDPSPVRAWPVIRSALGAAALNGPYWGFLFVVTYRLQADRGWSPLTTGLALLPTSLPLALTALSSGRLVSRFGPPRLITAGSLAALAGYAWYLYGDGRASYPAGVLPTALLVGIGYVLSFSALHVQAVSGVPPHRQGVVTGIYQTAVQLGGAATLAAVAFTAAASRSAALLVIASAAAAGWLVSAAGLATDRARSKTAASKTEASKTAASKTAASKTATSTSKEG